MARRFLTTAQRAPYVASLAAAQKDFLDGTVSLEYRSGRFGDDVDSSADHLGGRGRRTLSSIAHDAAQGRCAHCRQATRLDVAADAADAATLTLLIPASAIGASNERLGYVASNVCSMCRTCVTLSNDANRRSNVWTWMAGTFDAECVVFVWPNLPRIPAHVKSASTVDPAAWLREVLRVAAARGNDL